MARAVVLPLGVALGFGVGLGVVPAFTGEQVPSVPVVDPVVQLVEAHDCWTGAAPGDVEVPGHVIVSDGAGPRYGGERLVDLALRQLFEGEDHGLLVHAFCR